MHGVITRLVGGAGARAEDLAQEAFVRAWQALPSYPLRERLRHLAVRLAVNTALMELRSRRSQPFIDSGDDVLRRDRHDRFRRPRRGAVARTSKRAVATLPARARAVLVLHDVEGWKHEEIAAELDMAVGTSKAQLHRARKLLRTRLGEHA